MPSDIPKRLRTIADMIERGAMNRELLVGLSKIVRELSGALVDDTHLIISSVFGVITRKGMVRAEINNEWAMLEPDEARKQAMYLLEAASSAEFDEFVFTDMAPKANLDDRGAEALLIAFREWRGMGDKS
jgi:hypothetical protein